MSALFVRVAHHYLPTSQRLRCCEGVTRAVHSGSHVCVTGYAWHIICRALLLGEISSLEKHV